MIAARASLRGEEQRVLGLRRYPVKSMGGEGLSSVELDSRGLVGDRWYAVQDQDGRFASGKDTRRFRRRDAVFEYSARTTPEGVQVTGPGGRWIVGDDKLDQVLSAHMATPVRTLAERDVPHQDMGSISLIGSATLEWCAQKWCINADSRRLRVNILVSTTEPFVEESWEGKRITVGQAELSVVERVPRCRMIDIGQDGACAEGRWLKPLAAERDMFLAVYADVITPRPLHVGDLLSVG